MVGLASAFSFVAVLGMVAPPAGPAAPVTITRPTLSRPIDDLQLRLSEPRFRSPSELRILGEGRFGTWSLMGSSVGGQTCSATLGSRCGDMALAELGIAWRPFHSRVSLFSAVGVVSLARAGEGGLAQRMGAQLVGGLRIDLRSRLDWIRRTF